MKFNNVFIEAGLVCLCVAFSFGLIAQSFDATKAEIRGLNKAERPSLSLSNIVVDNNEKYIRDSISGKILGKYLGEINGFPISIYPLSEESAISTNTKPLNEGEPLGYNLEGNGMTLILDDVGAPLNDHLVFLAEDGESRIGANNEPETFHPTQMAGIICGNDSLGTAYKGMASKAKIEMIDNYGQQQYAESLVSNHSIIRSGGTYHYFFDYNTFNHPYHTEVTASGNSGWSAYSLRNNSKNEITVGNIEDIVEYDSPKDVVIVSTSSAGPTIDGRIKPDLVANGKGVLAASNSGISAIANSGGTSQACANTSGSLLLVQEYYHNQFDTYMKSSTLKALAVHTARESGSTPGPDYYFGYGVLNTLEMVKVIENDSLQTSLYELDLINDEVYSMDIFPNYDEPIVVTLAWTDPSGGQIIFPYNGGAIDTSLRALVNDLDIKITSNGNVYEPYTLDRMNPCDPAIAGNNTFDNLEMIEIPRPTNSDSAFSLEISHKGTLVNGHQNFSLIITGTSPTQVDKINQSIRIEEDADVQWSSDKLVYNDIIVNGKLDIESDITGIGENLTVSVLEDGELTLNNSLISNIDFYFFPNSKLILDGESSIEGANFYFLDSVIIENSDLAELLILSDTNFVYDYMNDIDLSGLVTPQNNLVESAFPGIMAERICLFDDQLVDTVYNLCANEVLLGYQSEDYSEGIDISAHVEIYSTSPLVNCQQLKVKANKSLKCKISENILSDPILVPEVELEPIVHKYYNGIKYLSNSCLYTPIIVYNQ